MDFQLPFVTKVGVAEQAVMMVRAEDVVLDENVDAREVVSAGETDVVMAGVFLVVFESMLVPERRPTTIAMGHIGTVVRLALYSREGFWSEAMTALPEILNLPRSPVGSCRRFQYNGPVAPSSSNDRDE